MRLRARMLIEDDELQARVRATIRDIAAVLAAHAPDDSDSSDALADHALLRTYLASDDTLVDDDDVGGSALRAAVARIPQLTRSALFGGVARVGWTIAHVVDESEANAACAPLDAALLEIVGRVPDYDLIGGVVGIGVYALERGAAGRPLATRVVDELERRAQPRAGGLAWHTAPELLPDHQREAAPEGYWNLGVAHGSPGAIGVLARMHRAGIEPARTRQLLDGAVAYLRANAPATAEPRFTAWEPGGGTPTARIAWCYGDLGIAAVLLGLPDEHARAEGLALARACAARPRPDRAHNDASLCHGTAGAAHLFHRMALATGDATLADAARDYVAITLAARTAEPLAGFPFWTPEERTPDATLLQGVAGIALVLHAAISDIEPAWDRLLLVDLPAVDGSLLP